MGSEAVNVHEKRKLKPSVELLVKQRNKVLDRIVALTRDAYFVPCDQIYNDLAQHFDSHLLDSIGLADPRNFYSNPSTFMLSEGDELAVRYVPNNHDGLSFRNNIQKPPTTYSKGRVSDRLTFPLSPDQVENEALESLKPDLGMDIVPQGGTHPLIFGLGLPPVNIQSNIR